MKKRKLLATLLILSSTSILADSLDPVDLLSDFVAVNTINPPGNESRAVDLYAKIFEQEGVEFSTAESAPGRGNIWARIEGGNEHVSLVKA